MLTSHKWDLVAFIWEQFTESAQDTILYNEFENYTFKITAISSRGQWVDKSYPFNENLYTWGNIL